MTDTSAHDSTVLGKLLDADNTDDEIYADSAYLSTTIVTMLTMMGFESHINKRVYRNRPPSEHRYLNTDTWKSQSVTPVSHRVDITTS